MVEVLEAGVCAFCGAKSALRPVCGRCARLVAELILRREEGGLLRWWKLTDHLAPASKDLGAALRAPPPDEVSEWNRDAQRWTPLHPEKQSGPEQAMTHAALADTYLDMKLHDDALFTAARAIEFDSPAATEVALAVIFDPRLIRRGAEQALRGLLFPG